MMKKYLQIFLLSCVAYFSASKLSAQVFTPAAGSNQINCGLNTTLCDHAGCSTDYSANANGYTIIQAIGSATITLSGSYTLGAGDQIIVYNGAGIGGTVLNTFTAGTGTYNFVGTPGQQITVQFISDAATQAAGFSFTITYGGSCTFPGTNFGATGNQSFPCATNMIFYDNGGAAGNYTNNVTSTVVLNNAGTGVYTLSGTYTLGVSDFVRIYSGVGTGGTLLATYTNATGAAINYSTQAGQTITIQFQTNASVVAAGFQINASHYGGCSCPSNVITATATPTSICSGQNSQLGVNGTAGVANYSISYPTYSPLPCSGSGGGAGPVGDDVSTGVLTLPFPFTYFGTTYTQFGISTNANIQFGPGPYSNVYTPSGSGIPTTSIDNLVALNFADWLADAGDINWYVQGTAPNRMVVVCFNTLHPYPGGTTGNLTGQIILYEGTNIIDLVLTDSWMGAGASTLSVQTQGLQDAQGVGVPVPGRNATNWTTTNSTVRFTPTLNYTYQWSPATFLNSTTIINPLATAMTSSQTYTVTASLGTQCVQTSSVAVTVNPTPTPAVVGTNTICSGQSTTLTASGGASFLWSTGATTAAVTVSPASTTTYNVTVSNGGCSAVGSRTVTVTTTPVPSPTAVPTSICLGQSTTITASGGGTYIWNTGATTASITVSPATTTTYSVTATNSGCVGSGSTTVTVSPSGAPVLTCPANIVLSACSPVATFATPTATDPCAPAVCAPAPLATVLANFNTNRAAITGAIPNPFNFTLDGGVTGTSISDGGSDMYDGGNILNTNLGSSIAYTNGVITASTAFGTGGQYFTTNFNNMFVMAADVNGLSSFSITGNNGADGSGVANGFTFNITVGCLTYNVFVKRVNGAGDPSINQIFIIPSGSAATHSFDTNTDNSLHTLSTMAGVTRLYYLLVGGNAGYAYTNAEIQTIVQNFLTQTGATGSSIAAPTVTQIAGLPSGSSFPVGTTTVTFRAVGFSGTTNCSFTVTVNPVTGPLMTCPSNINLGSCNPVATFTTPTATDPCTPPCTISPLSTILTNFNTNRATITGAIPNPYNFTLDGGVTGTSISDGGSDMYDGGNVLNTNLGSSIAYTNGVVTASTAFGTGGQYFTTNFNNMFVMAADVNGITSFSITGNNGADGSGLADGFTYTVTVGCQSYDVFVKRVNGAGDPSINQIVIVPAGSGSTQTFDTNTDNTLHTVSGLSGVTRLYYLLVGGNAGYAYTNAEIQTIVQNFLTQVSAAVASPVTVTQTAGLPSGSSFPVGTTVVTFQATGPSGTSTCSFNVNVTAPTAAISASTTSVCSGGSSTLTASGGGTYLWSTGATTAAITVTPAATTTYSVTVTSTFGCTATASQAITLNTASTVPTIAPVAASYCPNTTATLTASGGTAGTGSNIYWYTGPNGTGTLLGTGGSISVTTSTTMTIYARRQGTCNNTPDASVVINVKTYIYAANGTSTNTYCTDNAGWNHFYVGNNIIFSVRGNLSGAAAGFPVATIWDHGTYYQQHQGPFASSSCVNGWNPGEERFEMARSWNLNFGGGTSSGTYEIRFYYQPAERTAIENAAIAWMSTYPACGYGYKYATPLGFYWFKNTGSNYTAPLYDATHYSAIGGTTSNGINYAEWSGIPNFSGGSGAVIIVPTVLLPIDWEYFTGATQGRINKLEWATGKEENTDRFEVQRSRDGINFETIGTVAAAGNSTQPTQYQFDDINPFEGLNYYRLRLLDRDGAEHLSEIVVLEIDADGQAYVFFPNPTDDIVYYQFSSTVAEDVQIEVLDVLGRVLSNRQVKANVGANNLGVNLSEYPSGSYLVRVTHQSSGSVRSSKIIRQ